MSACEDSWHCECSAACGDAEMDFHELRESVSLIGAYCICGFCMSGFCVEGLLPVMAVFCV